MSAPRPPHAVRLAARFAARAALAATALALLAGCPDRSIEIGEAKLQTTGETVGSGDVAEVGRVACIDYEVQLPDGTVVIEGEDTCFLVGGDPMPGPRGGRRLGTITGVDEAVRGMRVGGRKTIQCPPSKHWGSQGYGPIPPKTTLTITIELNGVEDFEPRTAPPSAVDEWMDDFDG